MKTYKNIKEPTIY